MTGWWRRRAYAGIGGLVLGACAGVAVALGATGASAELPPGETLAPLFEATHLPPLLTTRGEPVELRYDVFCAPAGAEQPESEGSCDVSGTAFVRAGDSGEFAPLPLR